MADMVDAFRAKYPQADKVLCDILKEVDEDYAEYNVTNEDKVRLAMELYDSIFVKGEDLNQIFCIVGEFEQEQQYDGKEIDVSPECVIFSAIVNALKVDKFNAQRLYDSFLEYNEVGVFGLLMSVYDQFLSDEQRQNVLQIAKGTFDDVVLDGYV